MRDYVVTTDDNGGIHINSGILNRGFYLAAMAMEGKTHEVLGRIWYATLTGRLTPEADFADFTRATVDIAGETHLPLQLPQGQDRPLSAEVGLRKDRGGGDQVAIVILRKIRPSP